MILTNKALRKGDQSLDFARVELRFGWACTKKCCGRIFLDGLVLERFSDMVNEGKAMLTEFLGPAFKPEMLQHTRKYAFVIHVGGKCCI